MKATNELMFFEELRPGTFETRLILHQLWRHDDGTTEWRHIPIVKMGEKPPLPRLT